MTLAIGKALVIAAALGVGLGTAIAQPKVDVGKREYDSNCASCHGARGKGDGPNKPFLTKSPSDLTVLAKNNGGVMPVARMYEVIEGGRDVPLHFSAFHPDFKMTDLPPTPAATLTRARHIAREEGLSYVYTGNVHDSEGGSTFCPQCHALLVERDWHRILTYELSDDGRCPHCAAAIPGRFEPYAGSFGNRRVPVRLAAGR